MAEKKTASAVVAEAMRIGGRTPAFLWMWDNYDVLERAAAVGRVNWKVVSQRFAETEVGRGLGCSADALRMTWRRVAAQKRKAGTSGERLQQSAAQPRDEFYFPDSAGSISQADLDDMDRALGVKSK